MDFAPGFLRGLPDGCLGGIRHADGAAEVVGVHVVEAGAFGHGEGKVNRRRYPLRPLGTSPSDAGGGKVIRYCHLRAARHIRATSHPWRHRPRRSGGRRGHWIIVIIEDYLNSVISLARTSSIKSSGSTSIFRPPRSTMSSTRGWSQRTKPVVLIPVISTANPMRRAKLPPLVMGRTTGSLVASLNAVGETIKTGRLPCCSWPIDGLSETK